MTAVLYREPMTKADARVSVRRAFSFAEFATLARARGLAGFLSRPFRHRAAGGVVARSVVDPPLDAHDAPILPLLLR